MGYYLNGGSLGSDNKTRTLVEDYGAIEYAFCPKWQDIHPGNALVIVKENGLFDAAALIYSQTELEAFTDPSDTRPTHILLMDKKIAHEMCGYKE